MAILSDYTDGTVTVAANGTTVTGVGTAWQAAEFREGDWFLDGGGNAAIVASVNSNTSLTLTAPWKGPAITGGSYRLRYMSDGSRVSGQARQLINLLGGSGNLTALGGLSGVAGDVPVFTGPGTMGLVALDDIGPDITPYWLSRLGADADAEAARAGLGAGAVGVNVFVANDHPSALGALGATSVGGDVFTAANQAAGRSALGVNAVAAVTGAADRLPYFTSASAAAVTPLTALARSLLDDTTGAQMYATMGATQSTLAPVTAGYTKLPNGLIFQWGLLSAGGDQVISFPTGFPAGGIGVWAQPYYEPLDTATLISITITSFSAFSATARVRYAQSGGAVGASAAVGYWFALGV